MLYRRNEWFKPYVRYAYIQSDVRYGYVQNVYTTKMCIQPYVRYGYIQSDVTNGSNHEIDIVMIARLAISYNRYGGVRSALVVHIGI